MFTRPTKLDLQNDARNATSLISHHYLDANEMPEGGVSFGPGFAISWQRGPLGSGIDRIPQNGAFVETLIEAVIDRIEFYQRTQFESEYNAAALAHLYQAVDALNARTKSREDRGVEGTMTV